MRLGRFSNLAATLGLLLGAGFFVWLVLKVDTTPLVSTFRDSWHWVFAIALLYGVAQAGYTLAWRTALSTHRISFWRLFAVYNAGDAASYAVPLSGEGLKATMLRPAYTTTQGLFSVSVAKYCEFIAQLIFYALGFSMTLFAFPLPARMRWGGLAIFMVLLAGVTALARLQKRGFYAGLADLGERLTRRKVPDATRLKIAELDALISKFYAENPKGFAQCVALKLCGKLGGVIEAAATLALLGHPPTVAACFAIETLSMIANDLLTFVPGRVGAAEGGRTLVFVMLGYTAPEGLVYAAIRRLRELLWVGVGLGVILAERVRSPRGVRAVLFDFDGTLDGGGRPRRERLLGGFLEHGIQVERGRFETACANAERQLKRRPEVSRGGLKETVAAEVDAIFDELGLDGDGRRRGIVDGFVREAESQLAKSREVLGRLRGRFRLAIVDNYFGNLGRVCLEAGLAEAVDVVVDSGAVGIEKPDPRIFEYALTRLGTTSDEALYVGDSHEDDLDGAREAGLRHLWLRAEGSAGRACCWDDHTIHAIGEIESALGPAA